MTLLLTLCLVFFLAGLVQGISGFGSALVAIPLLTLVIDIKEAIPLCMLISLVITTYLSLQLRRHFDRKKLLPLCIGAVPGIIVGATLLKLVPSEIIRVLLGVLIISYSMYSLASTPKERRLKEKWGYLAGFLSGAIGAAFSAGGPPAIIYSTLKSWGKDEIKATLTGFFCFNSYLGAVAHAVSGLTTATVFHSFLISVPAVLLGTAAGSYCYGFFPREIYLKIIYIFLIIIGTMMIL